MALVKVKNKYQIVIPEEVRKRLRVEVGDMLEVYEKDGSLVARPVVVIDKSQAYFWTPEWQKGERDANKDIKEGRVSEPFGDAGKLVAHLRKKK